MADEHKKEFEELDEYLKKWDKNNLATWERIFTSISFEILWIDQGYQTIVRRDGDAIYSEAPCFNYLLRRSVEAGDIPVSVLPREMD